MGQTEVYMSSKKSDTVSQKSAMFQVPNELTLFGHKPAWSPISETTTVKCYLHPRPKSCAMAVAEVEQLLTFLVF